MQEFMTLEIFSVGDWSVQLNTLLGVSLFMLIHISLLFIALKYWNNWLIKREIYDWSKEQRLKINLVAGWCLLLIWGSMVILGLNPLIYATEEDDGLFTSTLIMAATFVVLATLADKILNKILTDRYFENKKLGRAYRIPIGLKQRPKPNNRTIFNVVITLVILMLIRGLGIDFKLFEIPTGADAANLTFRFSHVFVLLLTFFAAKLLSWLLTKFILVRYYRTKDLNPGLQFAINQILTYFIYVIAIFMVIDFIGIQFTLLLGGLAALLVGIGLGLQQTFNDLMSGIILLFERSIEVGDVIEFEGTVGAVERIGVRTSLIETRDHIIIIVPNSMLITDRVINWSHFDDKARFRIPVGVAYGSDTRLVEKLLLEVAREDESVLEVPAPSVQFRDFGNSSLDFMLFFWSKDYISIEAIKSKLRYDIDKKFRENNVTIPFPQRDLWIKNPEVLNPPPGKSANRRVDPPEE